MSDYLSIMLERYRTEGALIDSNLLLLLMIGQFNARLVGTSRHLRQYSREDLELLCELRQHFERIVTTPNVLTEVTNLAGRLQQDVRRGVLAAISDQISLLDESYVRSTEAASDPLFAPLGLTDAGIAHLSQNRYLVFSDDLTLTSSLSRRGIDCININHIRSAIWLR